MSNCLKYRIGSPEWFLFEAGSASAQTPQQALEALLGITIDHGWAGVKESIMDTGGHDLTLGGATPATDGNSTTGLVAGNGVSEVAFNVAESTSDSAAATTLTVAKPVAATASLWGVLFKAAAQSATRNLFGWRDGAPNYAGAEAQLTTSGTFTGRYDWSSGDFAWTIAGDHCDSEWHLILILDKQPATDVIIGTDLTGAASKGTSAGVATSTTQMFSLGAARITSFGGEIALGFFSQDAALASWTTSSVDTAISAVMAGMVA